MPSPNEKPHAGERAEGLVDEAFRYVRLTQEFAAIPRGDVADAITLRAALVALAVKYNVTGEELVQMSRLAAWRLHQQVQTPQEKKQ